MENGAMKKMAIRVAAPLLLLTGIGIVSFQVMGEPEETEIMDCQGLQDISKNTEGRYVLGGDIDCSKHEGFMPISNFSGTFDGGKPDGSNFTITGLTIHTSAITAGLFGSATTGEIKNTTFEDLSVYGYIPSGAIAATISGNAVIDNIHVKGNVYGTGAFASDQIGGLVGVASGGSIKNSSFEGAVDVPYSGSGDPTGIAVGGLVGGVHGATFSIENSYFKGTVSIEGSADLAGGLIGFSSSSGVVEIKNSYSDAVVRGSMQAGGLDGSGSATTIENSYATGTVISVGKVAGLAVVGKSIKNSYSTALLSAPATAGLVLGLTTEGSVQDSYWAYDRANTRYSAGGTEKLSSDMKKQATYEGWDFQDVWTIEEDRGFPTLRSTPSPEAVPVSAK